MATAVTCLYKVNPTGALTAAQLAALMAAIVPPPGFYALTGATLTSATAAVVGGVAEYSVVFNVTSAQFNAQFPVNVLGPFWGLLTGPLASYLNQPVIEVAPVAT
jgi:hypothetical protein